MTSVKALASVDGSRCELEGMIEAWQAGKPHAMVVLFEKHHGCTDSFQLALLPLQRFLSRRISGWCATLLGRVVSESKLPVAVEVGAKLRMHPAG
jgi:hypothetical protein